MNSDSVKPKAKRGPGRPKGATKTTRKASSSLSSSSSGKRGRGRPKKEATAGESSTSLREAQPSVLTRSSTSKRRSEKSEESPEQRRKIPKGAKAISQTSSSTNDDDNSCRPYGTFPGHEAALYGMKAGSKINDQDKDGKTLLHHAAKCGDVETVKKLLAAGASTRIQERIFGHTPLHAALCFHKRDAAAILLEADSKISIKDTMGGYSPLHLTAQQGYAEEARKLLAAGANTRLLDDRGRTPLHLALSFSKKDVTAVLLDADSKIDIQDEDGWTPLFEAVLEGAEEVRKLISAGVNTRLRDRDRGWTPLHRALYFNKKDIAAILLHADSEINVKDKKGRTPLHLAVEEGNTEAVRQLLLSDVYVHVKDHSGNYPLNYGNQAAWEMILPIYAFRDIAIDWKELKLKPEQTQYCVELLSKCYADLQQMKDTKVQGTTVSYHDLVRVHVSKTAMYLRNESVRKVLHCDRATKDFPNYAHMIEFRLKKAEERRILSDQFLKCFGNLSRTFPPLPAMIVDIIILCLSGQDMQNFISAFNIKI